MCANPADGTVSREPVVSVIVPARNEEASLGHCLASLVNQSGIAYEIIIVNDHSTDRTRQIADAYPTVELLDADELPPGWTGKSHAIHCGVRHARGRWLLFTDADTVHRRGSLRRAVHEAKEHGVDMLSFSPKQEVHGPWERSLMPVIFAELRRQYPPKLVMDPNSPVVAANGQYILIRRDTYEAIGGHEAIRNSLLEDVELARLVKKSGGKIRFRYGRDAVKTRMYRSFRQMWDGWTKNLSLLFPDTTKLAAIRAAEFLFSFGGMLLIFYGLFHRSAVLAAAGALISLPVTFNFFRRVRKAHFGWLNTIISPAGLPIFVILLLRSRLHYLRDKVTWKGRVYNPGKETLQESRETLTAR